MLVFIRLGSTAETRAAALEQTLAIFQDDHPNVVQHMKAEADALQKLSEVTEQLEKYQTVYGDPSTLPPDVSKLADQARQKESEIQKLRLLDTQRGQVSHSGPGNRCFCVTFGIRLRRRCMLNWISCQLLGRH